MNKLNLLFLLLLIISGCNEDSDDSPIGTTEILSSSNFKYFPSLRMELEDAEMLADGSLVLAGIGNEAGQSGNYPSLLQIDPNKELTLTSILRSVDYASLKMDILQVIDDEFIIITGYRNIDVLKTSIGSNQPFWHHQISEAGRHNSGKSACHADGGNFIISGEEKSIDDPFSFDYFIKKLSPNGDEIWSTTMERDSNSSVKVHRVLYLPNEENIIVLVEETNFSGGGETLDLVIFDKEGNQINTFNLSDIHIPLGVDMKLLDSGEIMVYYAAEMDAQNEGYELIIKKFNSSMTQTFIHIDNEVISNSPADVIHTSDGNIIYLSNTYSLTEDQNSDEYDVVLTKINTAGETIWRKIYDGEVWDRGNRIFETNDGFIMTGNSGKDIFILETDASGNPL